MPMQPAVYTLKPELKARLETGLQSLSDEIGYKELNYPVVNKMGILFGNSKKVCKALEAVLCDSTDALQPDYARYGLQPPTEEELAQAKEFLETLENIALNGSQGAYLVKGLPQDKRLSLLAMGLPYFFGDVTNTARTGNIKDANGYPKIMKADRLAKTGDALKNHAQQLLHIDGEEASVHIHKPNYMLRFLVSRGKGDVDLSTNIYSIPEFISHVADTLIEEASGDAFLTQHCGDAPSHDHVVKLIEEALCKPIWPAPTVPALHGDKKSSALQPMMLRDQQGNLFIHHFVNVLNKLAPREESNIWNVWQKCLARDCPPEEVHFYDALAQAMQHARSDMKTVDGLVLEDGQMLVYNDRRAIHGPGKLEEGVHSTKARTIVNTAAHRRFDPNETSGSLTPR